MWTKNWAQTFVYYSKLLRTYWLQDSRDTDNCKIFTLSCAELQTCYPEAPEVVHLGPQLSTFESRSTGHTFLMRGGSSCFLGHFRAISWSFSVHFCVIFVPFLGHFQSIHEFAYIHFYLQIISWLFPEYCYIRFHEWPRILEKVRNGPEMVRKWSRNGPKWLRNGQKRLRNPTKR